MMIFFKQTVIVYCNTINSLFVIHNVTYKNQQSTRSKRASKLANQSDLLNPREAKLYLELDKKKFKQTENITIISIIILH